MYRFTTSESVVQYPVFVFVKPALSSALAVQAGALPPTSGDAQIVEHVGQRRAVRHLSTTTR
jgi:hypothetical protein